VGLLVAPQRPPQDLAAGADPTTAPATVQEFSDSRAVTLTYRTGSDVPLMAHTAGVVTGMPDALTATSGAPVVWVGDLPLIGLATTTPLYRDLTLGDKGNDVQALNAELARLGYDAPQSTSFTTVTRTAWTALQRACGVTSPAQGVSLSGVVWLPGASVQVQTWTFALGTPTPADGVLGVVAGGVESASVAMSDGSPLLTDGRTLTVAGVTIDLPPDGIMLDAGFLAATIGRTQSVSTDGVTYSRQAQGTIQLATPLTVLAVPPVAVFAVVGASGCLQVGQTGVPVTVVGSSMGVSLVTTGDGSTPSQVAIGTGITVSGCS